MFVQKSIVIACCHVVATDAIDTGTRGGIASPARVRIRNMGGPRIFVDILA